VEKTQRYEGGKLRDMSGENSETCAEEHRDMRGKLRDMSGETQKYEGGNSEI
jgi:hypothetical protein